MGDISRHFDRSEFACKCGCGQDTVDVGLIALLEEVREFFDKPVRITSGNRCKAHNESEGGSLTSQHLTGRAADIQVKDIDPAVVYEYLDDKAGGLGKYDSFTHLDSRLGRARW